MTKKEKVLTEKQMEKKEQQTPVEKESVHSKIRKVHSKARKHHLKISTALLIALVILFAGVWYLQTLQSKVYIENSEINAPIISLGPQASGILEEIYVKEGDRVYKNKIVAQVGGQPIRTQTSGIIVEVDNTPGQVISPQQGIIKMIDPREFRVIGRVEEDKGLSDIKPGQKVVFTVDAFGSKEYEGIVDAISETSRQSDIVFSISDKREQKEFNIKVSFDANAYPELKNGMSAKMWIYK